MGGGNDGRGMWGTRQDRAATGSRERSDLSQSLVDNRELLPRWRRVRRGDRSEGWRGQLRILRRGKCCAWQWLPVLGGLLNQHDMELPCRHCGGPMVKCEKLAII